MILYGDPKIGKSFASLQLACDIVTGGRWLGEFPVRTTGPVICIQCDTPRSLWAKRLEELIAAGHPLHAIRIADKEVLGCFPLDIMNPEHVARLTRSLALLKPVAVIFDTLREIHGLDENSSTDMKNVIAALAACVAPAALILISHSRKPSQEAGSGADLINDQRGTGYVVGRMDAIVRFSKTKVRFQGRATEEGTIQLERRDDCLWYPIPENEFHSQTEEVLDNKTLITPTEKAKALALASGKDFEACRTLLRRRLKTRKR